VDCTDRQQEFCSIELVDCPVWCVVGRPSPQGSCGHAVTVLICCGNCDASPAVGDVDRERHHEGKLLLSIFNILPTCIQRHTDPLFRDVAYMGHGYDLPSFVGYTDFNREIILNSNFQRYKGDHNNLYSSAKTIYCYRCFGAW
jgi:hypothetical protein